MKKKTTIVHFVRHGEVENPRSIRYGRLPGFHLSERGRKQVEQTSLFFVKRPIDHIYSSPLERTQQTATLLGFAFPHIPITIDSRILEIQTSSQIEGKTRETNFHHLLQPASDAETMAEITARMRHFTEEKIIEHQGREIIAVSHGDPIALLYHSLVYRCESPNAHLYPSYGSVISFVFSGIQLVEAWYFDQEPTKVLFFL